MTRLVHERAKPERDVSLQVTENATLAVAGFKPGRDLVGVTKGQFSLFDLILALLEITGPADLTIATWTAAKKEIASAERLLRAGAVRSCRWLVDFSFPRRQPEYCRDLVARFGPECIRTTATHAKFVLLRNEAWDVVLRTSMNLNKNPRLEFFEISDDRKMAAFLDKLAGELFTENPPIDLQERPIEAVKRFDGFGRPIGPIEASELGKDLDDPRAPGLGVLS